VSKLHVPVSELPALGEVMFGTRAGMGEASIDVELGVRDGRWHARYLDEEALDALIGDGVLPEPDEHLAFGTQLLLVHGERDVPTEQEIAQLREIARIRIEGARFTIADVKLAKELQGDEGFDDQLDGVHGPLANGRGLTVMLDGDGTAIAYADSKDAATIILVDLV
jgi:hypothetical protein